MLSEKSNYILRVAGANQNNKIFDRSSTMDCAYNVAFSSSSLIRSSDSHTNNHVIINARRIKRAMDNVDLESGPLDGGTSLTRHSSIKSSTVVSRTISIFFVCDGSSLPFTLVLRCTLVTRSKVNPGTEHDVIALSKQIFLAEAACHATCRERWISTSAPPPNSSSPRLPHPDPHYDSQSHTRPPCVLYTPP